MPIGPRRTRLIGVLVVALSAAVFWRTAYPTITWWDSANYSTAASTLALTAPPGSLLLVLLGWVVTRLPSGFSPAHTLNLFAGLLGAIAAVLVYVIALQLVRRTRGADGESTDRMGVAVAAALGALSFAFSATLWEHAVKFTPYVLTVVFTGLILWTMLKWWDDAENPGSWRWLLLLGLLFGLDFSVHRTNALLIPGAMVWVLIRNPRTFLVPKALVGAVGGLCVGLAFHLLIIPIAQNTQAPFSQNEPTNLSGFWAYISLEQLGGNFLVNLWPRKSPFWSNQVADFLRVLRNNFAHLNTPAGVLGVLPLAAATIGITALWRRERRLALAFALALFLQAAMTVIYFNIPADFFRSLDRHYLPVCFTLAVLVAYGLTVVARAAPAFARTNRLVVVAVATIALLLVPAAQLVGNFAGQDASDRHFTRDFAVNLLEALPPNAIVFTAGDNDTFPLWYVQAVERVRPDVAIVNMSLTNVPWYTDRLLRFNPSFPLAMSNAERERLVKEPWPDSLRVDSVTVRPRLQSTQAILWDAVLLDVVQTNHWRRPITFAMTTGEWGRSWLDSFARLEGLHWRIVPSSGARIDVETLRANLLERYEYRGYADSSTVIEETTRMIGFHYVTALSELMGAELERGGASACREAFARFSAQLPIERLSLPDAAGNVGAKCG